MTFLVGDYRAIELIGAGGTSQVWRGEVVSTGAPVALKAFPPGQMAAARREAALAAAVDHPHVLKVLDVVGDDEHAVLVTELAVGGDLADLLLRRGRLSAGETLTVLLPVAAALATAHERQIVHGDLSAQNILFDRAGRPLLADLGAGRAAAEHDRPVALTPADAAPELARGGTPCAATDMFSLGSIALACLTGRHAWPADDLRDVLIQAAGGQWPDPADVDGPPLLIRAIRGLLEHDAERRPAAASLVMDLRSAGRPEPIDFRLGDLPTDASGSGAGLADVGKGRPGGDGKPAGGAGAGTAGVFLLGADRTSGPPAQALGRHGRPTEASGHASAAFHLDDQLDHHPDDHLDDRLDPGRAGRARAVTRVRPDAGPPSSAPVPQGREWRPSSMLRARGSSRPRRPGGNGVGGSRPSRAARIAILVLVGVVVAGLAGAGGLWWARWDITDPAVLSQSAASAAATTPVGPTAAVSTAVPTSSVSLPRGTATSAPRPPQPLAHNLRRRLPGAPNQPGRRPRRPRLRGS